MNNGNIKNKQKKNKTKKIKNIVRKRRVRVNRPKQIRLPRLVSQMSIYKKALLCPETVEQARWSGSTLATIPLRRKLVYRGTTNAAGNFVAIYDPSLLKEVSSTRSTLAVLKPASAYDGNSAPANVNLIHIDFPQRVTDGSVKTFRLVSCSFTVRSIVANINKSGIIMGAVKQITSSPAGIVGADTGFSGVTLQSLYPPGIDDQTLHTFVKADASNGEGVRLLWLPSCMEEADCNAINQNFAMANTASTVNQFVAIGLGLGASSPYEIDITGNYEVVPEIGSILVGIESMSTEKQYPPSVWQDVMLTGLAKTIINTAGIPQANNNAYSSSTNTLTDSLNSLNIGDIRNLNKNVLQNELNNYAKQMLRNSQQYR